jgi:hypothetical protein
MNPVRVAPECLRELKLAWSYLDALNYMIIQSLRKYYTLWGDAYQYEFYRCLKVKIKEISNEFKQKANCSEPDENGKFVYHCR